MVYTKSMRDDAYAKIAEWEASGREAREVCDLLRRNADELLAMSEQEDRIMTGVWLFLTGLTIGAVFL